MQPTRKKILAVASGGGHWLQLRRLLPAFEGHELVFATTMRGYESDAHGARVYLVPDANRWEKIRLLGQLIQVAWVVLRERPDVVVSTGAAPGYLALFLAKWLGARTIWVDSVANAEELSLSGARIGRWADLWLTQWPHLARPDGPRYEGAVI